MPSSAVVICNKVRVVTRAVKRRRGNILILVDLIDRLKVGKLFFFKIGRQTGGRACFDRELENSLETSFPIYRKVGNAWKHRQEVNSVLSMIV